MYLLQHVDTASDEISRRDLTFGKAIVGFTSLVWTFLYNTGHSWTNVKGAQVKLTIPGKVFMLDCVTTLNVNNELFLFGLRQKKTL